MIIKKQIEISNEEAQFLYGIRDENLEFIENLFGIEIFARGNLLTLKGENEKVEKVLDLLHEILKNRTKKKYITKNDILMMIEEDKEKKEIKDEELKEKKVVF